MDMSAVNEGEDIFLVMIISSFPWQMKHLSRLHCFRAPSGSPGSAAVVSGRFRIIKGYLNFLDTYTPAHTAISADFR